MTNLGKNKRKIDIRTVGEGEVSHHPWHIISGISQGLLNPWELSAYREHFRVMSYELPVLS